MGRATSFRVDIIKARFCNALLAQFSKDIKKEGTVSFRVRSQWDVASLARDKDEAEFRISDFTAKALEVIDISGPLLIFCLLGGLILRAVPLDQSGVEPEDIKRVWELQRKVIDKERLPLNRPSDPVWGKVDRLRNQELLRTIDCVGNYRFSGSEGPGQSEPAEEQGCETLVAVDPTLSLGKRSADDISDGNMRTHALSEFHQTYESGSLNDPSPHPNIQAYLP
ncbi:hypothetical protein BJV77DRAFT_1052850, partial [Russula vinacea]